MIFKYSKQFRFAPLFDKIPTYLQAFVSVLTYHRLQKMDTFLCKHKIFILAVYMIFKYSKQFLTWSLYRDRNIILDVANLLFHFL